MLVITSKIKSLLYRIPFGGRVVVLFQTWYPKLLLLFQSPKRVFTDIHDENYWSEHRTVSGPGSTIDATESLRRELPKLLKEYNIRSILDIPCGDFAWMKEVDLAAIGYIGADIVEKIVRQNAEQYEREGRRFLELNIISDPLPQSDLVMVRDCFVHFSYKDIRRSLKNIIASNSLWLFTTTFTESENSDILTGFWRPIDLMKPPFNFPLPLIIVKENITDPQYADKSMALWKIDDLRNFA
ncbi:MAG: class I SAM-dependent methyltransferase [Ignavibacteriales bacterium]|nr:class I SAM-dependent methyltransferase [Ignavibacteriales bacterium]